MIRWAPEMAMPTTVAHTLTGNDRPEHKPPFVRKGERSVRHEACDQVFRVEHVVAVEVLEPVRLVDRVEVAFAEVRGDGDGGAVGAAVFGEPAHGAADDGAGGTAEEEVAAGQSVAAP